MGEMTVEGLCYGLTVTINEFKIPDEISPEFFGGKQIWHIMKMRFKISEYIFFFTIFYNKNYF